MLRHTSMTIDQKREYIKQYYKNAGPQFLNRLRAMPDEQIASFYNRISTVVTPKKITEPTKKVWFICSDCNISISRTEPNIPENVICPLCKSKMNRIG